MNFFLFLPHFLGARGRCSQSERVLYGRDLCSSEGTGKAEPAKLSGAGIGPKPCPGKCAAEKGYLPKSGSIMGKGRFEPAKCENCGRDAGCPAPPARIRASAL